MILWYKDFLQLSTAENVSILSEAYENLKKNQNSRGRDLEVEIDRQFFFPAKTTQEDNQNNYQYLLG